MSQIRFSGYPSTFVYKEPDKKSEWINHLLWGEWVQVLEELGDWVKVNVRGELDGYMLKSDLQPNKLVELYFVDIGQGDGCLAILPDKQSSEDDAPSDFRILIDAGENDNMLRFINWKFNTRNQNNAPFLINDVVITHSDADHYKGLQPIFERTRFLFENVYHNGLVERATGDMLGPRQKIGKVTYQTDIISTHSELERIIADPTAVGRKLYPKLLKTAAGRGANIQMLCNEDGYLPRFPGNSDIKIRVLGPVVERNAEGKRLLRRFKSDDGKTKNGHSIILQLEYNKVKILLGGDLNVPAENYLLQVYGGGTDPQKANSQEIETLIANARTYFESDVAKACHHGSGDFSTAFLRTVNAAATIVSSGDDEPHSHPRPNTLGALGKYGRGEFPLIFSTELARSAKEKIKFPSEIRKEIENLQTRIGALYGLPDGPEKERKIAELEKAKQALYEKLGRTVEIYGMINVRTDGEKIIVAQRLERKSDRGAWDIHRLEPSTNGGVLNYVDDMDKHA